MCWVWVGGVFVKWELLNCKTGARRVYTVEPSGLEKILEAARTGKKIVWKDDGADGSPNQRS